MKNNNSKTNHAQMVRKAEMSGAILYHYYLPFEAKGIVLASLLSDGRALNMIFRVMDLISDGVLNVIDRRVKIAEKYRLLMATIDVQPRIKAALAVSQVVVNSEYTLSEISAALHLLIELGVVETDEENPALVSLSQTRESIEEFATGE